jgi:lysyl-tRNA synthetase class 1
MTEPNSEQLRYWVDQVCQKIVDKYPTGDLRVCSGISPSGPYHIGHSREILTADAIKRGLVERGRNIEHVHFVDDFDFCIADAK